MLKFKKGSMFGLDARISLSIFGTLSVISGAALFSAIEKANVISLITDLNEISKAYEAYYLDTQLELTNPGGRYLKIEDLVTGTAPGWRGPYLNYEVRTWKNLTHPKYQSDIFFTKLQDITWGSEVDTDWAGNTTPGHADNICTPSKNCFTWVGINFIDLLLAKKVSMEIDGNEDLTTGKVRYYDEHIFLKSRPYYG